MITRALGRRLAGRRRRLDDARARGRRDPALHRRPQRLRRRGGDRAHRSSEHDDLDVAVHALVDAANAAGGEDNITAVAVRLEADDGRDAARTARSPTTARRPRSRPSRRPPSRRRAEPSPIRARPSEPPPSRSRSAAARRSERERVEPLSSRPVPVAAAAQRRDAHLRAGRRHGLRQRRARAAPRARAPPGRVRRGRRADAVRALGCADRAALVALRRRRSRPPARSPSTRASRTTSAAA